MCVPIYTEAQLGQYFDRIGYPRSVHSHSDDALSFLAELQKRNLASVPFEDVSLHYSKHRLLSLDPDDLFDKIVTNSRGGYCMEVNCFFGTVLRSLGFTVTNVGGRVNGPNGYGGWSHMVNLVTIDGKTYLVDVAYGSNSPCRPVPLESGIEFDGVLPQRGRLDHKSLAKHTDSKQRVWVYSTQPSTDSAWKEEYCFVEVEFFPEDFGVMNLSTMTAPQSFFVQTVVATKILLNTQTAEPEGVLILHKDYVKRRIGEHTEVVQTLETEEQRVRALREHFLIDLRPGEQRAIHGMPSELKSGKAQPSGLH